MLPFRAERVSRCGPDWCYVKHSIRAAFVKQKVIAQTKKVFTMKPCRIAIKLREAMLAYRRRTGERMTYAILAERTGLAEGTLHNMGSHRKYNATLTTIARICRALEVSPGDLLEVVDELPKAKRAAGRKRGGA
jgi:DNA-binding Xre family transcriptional regulator